MAEYFVHYITNTNSGDIVALNNTFFCLRLDVCFIKHFLKIPKFCMYILTTHNPEIHKSAQHKIQ